VLKRFFENYKALEQKRVVVEEILPAERALQVIEQCLIGYRKQFSLQAHVNGRGKLVWAHAFADF